MSNIVMTELSRANGPNARQFSAEGFVVVITSDERFFTIFDRFGEPCATITRPLVLSKDQHWQAHAPGGEAITRSAVGPRSAFRSFLVWQGK